MAADIASEEEEEDGEEEEGDEEYDEVEGGENFASLGGASDDDGGSGDNSDDGDEGMEGEGGSDAGSKGKVRAASKGGKQGAKKREKVQTGGDSCWALGDAAWRGLNAAPPRPLSRTLSTCGKMGLVARIAHFLWLVKTVAPFSFVFPFRKLVHFSTVIATAVLSMNGGHFCFFGGTHVQDSSVCFDDWVQRETRQRLLRLLLVLSPMLCFLADRGHVFRPR